MGGMGPDDEDDDDQQQGRQLALKSLTAQLGFDDNSKPSDEDPDSGLDGSGFMGNDFSLLAKKKAQKSGGSGGGMGGMMGGGGGSGGGGGMDISSLASMFG